MPQGTRAKAWMRQATIAAGYGCGIALFRQAVVPHLLLITGVHLAVLMLTRYRDWPALVVGEAVSLVPISVACAPQWGWAWAATNMIPSIVLMAPWVYLARERMQLLRDGNVPGISALLACALLVAVTMTAFNLLTFSLTVLPPAYQANYEHLAAQWMLGNYLGILTVAPAALCIYRQWRDTPQHEWLAPLTEDRRVLESLAITLAMLVLVIWIGLSEPHLRSSMQVILFLPVVWLALRHGWQGAALGGSACSLAVLALMPALYDHETIQAEIVIAFVISSMLLLGARIGVLDQRTEHERIQVRTALALAQRNVHMGEMQLRSTSVALEQVRESMQAGMQLLLARLQQFYPEDRGYQRQALLAQDQLYRLSDTLYPFTWQERGLPVALRQGSVARWLEEAGLPLRCDIRGPLSRLSPALHLALYRAIVDAIADAATRKNCTGIDIRIKCGERAGRLWALVSMSFAVTNETVTAVPWEELLPRLTRASSGLGWQAIADRAATFEGSAHEHQFAARRRITLRLLDPA